MILGVGVDIVKVDKIKRAVEKWGEDFLKKVFNSKELKNIEEGKMYYQKISTRFAAKEAIIKATSSFLPLSFKDITILNRKNGAPYCELKKGKGIDIHLSLSHIEECAVACAVCERKK